MTTALVTGGNKGIGYVIAEGLGALGWSVGVGARDDTRREQAVAALTAAGVDAFGVPLDVTDDASVAAGLVLPVQGQGTLWSPRTPIRARASASALAGAGV